MGAGLPSFRHGVHPAECKEATCGLVSQRLPFMERYELALRQHIGAPSRPLVVAGERVRRGQRIAEPGGFVSTSLHAPVTGTVLAVGPCRLPDGRIDTAIRIQADAFDQQELPARPVGDWKGLESKQLVEGVQAAGIVGMGGAAFPTHVKYSLPEGPGAGKGGGIRRLVINGAECEPWLSCDHRLMLERTRDVLDGTRIVAQLLGVDEVVVGVEGNKLDAVQALQGAIEAGAGGQPRPRVVTLKVKYPQGAEKMLIRALTGVEVPGGKLPLDVQMVVNNVGTMAAVADWFLRGKPLVERLVTVSGPGVAEPANLLVPLGTPVRALLEACGGVDPDLQLVLMGGPMMGLPLPSLDVPVLKGTSGILAFRGCDLREPREYACIRCGRCLDACACFLNPSRLGRLARLERFEQMEAHHVLDCMECGACSYICPSRIPLVQHFRIAKGEIRKLQQKRQREAVS